MADLDSTSKRRSSVQTLSPWQLSLVLPDGAIGQGDRQHTVWTYAGILSSSPSAIIPETVSFVAYIDQATDWAVYIDQQLDIQVYR